MTDQEKKEMLKNPEIRDFYRACEEPAMREAALEILESATTSEIKFKNGASVRLLSAEPKDKLKGGKNVLV